MWIPEAIVVQIEYDLRDQRGWRDLTSAVGIFLELVKTRVSIMRSLNLVGLPSIEKENGLKPESLVLALLVSRVFQVVSIPTLS